MVTKTIGDKGEIVIPKKIREMAGLKSHSEVEIISTKSGIMIVPLVKDFRKLSGMFKEYKDTDMDKLDKNVLDIIYDI